MRRRVSKGKPTPEAARLLAKAKQDYDEHHAEAYASWDRARKAAEDGKGFILPQR